MPSDTNEPSAPATLKTTLTVAALALLVTACATEYAATDCHPLREPPLTGADVDAVSDGMALWLESAYRICNW